MIRLGFRVSPADYRGALRVALATIRRTVNRPKTKTDLGLVIRAAHFAAHKHKGQRRKDAKASPPAGWPLSRRQQYFDWAKEVVDKVRGVNPELERMFDRLYLQRPRAPDRDQPNVFAASSNDSVRSFSS